MISEIGEIQVQLREKWIIFGWSAGIGLLALWIAWKRGFFKPFQSSPYPIIRGVDVLRGFAFFLITELFLIPTLIGLVLTFSGKNPDLSSLSQQAKSLFNLSIIVGGFGGVSLAYFFLTPVQRAQLWQQTGEPWTHQIGVGIAAWFVSYPVVLAMSQILSIITWHLFHRPLVEQVAVKSLRKAAANPLIFGWTALAVVTIVPLMEEFLFRGLLQSWLKRTLRNVPAAIGLSSLIFAFFHFSISQGVTNIELLTSLFILSCVLGYIYERQRSLWAPIGLHGFFNFMSLLMIFQE